MPSSVPPPRTSALRRAAGAVGLALLLAAGAPAAAATELDLNTATQAQLEQLRGIGVALSEKLLAERARQPFADWRDLIARVPGIGARGAARLSAQGLRVDGRAWEEAQAPAPR